MMGWDDFRRHNVFEVGLGTKLFFGMIDGVQIYLLKRCIRFFSPVPIIRMPLLHLCLRNQGKGGAGFGV
jgi:hypothetical protein